MIHSEVSGQHLIETLVCQPHTRPFSHSDRFPDVEVSVLVKLRLQLEHILVQQAKIPKLRAP